MSVVTSDIGGYYEPDRPDVSLPPDASGNVWDSSIQGYRDKWGNVSFDGGGTWSNGGSSAPPPAASPASQSPDQSNNQDTWGIASAAGMGIGDVGIKGSVLAPFRNGGYMPQWPPAPPVTPEYQDFPRPGPHPADIVPQPGGTFDPGWPQDWPVHPLQGTPSSDISARAWTGEGIQPSIPPVWDSSIQAYRDQWGNTSPDGVNWSNGSSSAPPPRTSTEPDQSGNVWDSNLQATKDKSGNVWDPSTGFWKDPSKNVYAGTSDTGQSQWATPEQAAPYETMAKVQNTFNFGQGLLGAMQDYGSQLPPPRAAQPPPVTNGVMTAEDFAAQRAAQPPGFRLQLPTTNSDVSYGLPGENINAGQPTGGGLLDRIAGGLRKVPGVGAAADVVAAVPDWNSRVNERLKQNEPGSLAAALAPGRGSANFESITGKKTEDLPYGTGTLASTAFDPTTYLPLAAAGRMPSLVERLAGPILDASRSPAVRIGTELAANAAGMALGEKAGKLATEHLPDTTVPIPGVGKVPLWPTVASVAGGAVGGLSVIGAEKALERGVPSAARSLTTGALAGETGGGPLPSFRGNPSDTVTMYHGSATGLKGSPEAGTWLVGEPRVGEEYTRISRDKPVMPKGKPVGALYEIQVRRDALRPVEGSHFLAGAGAMRLDDPSGIVSIRRLPSNEVMDIQKQSLGDAMLRQSKAAESLSGGAGGLTEVGNTLGGPSVLQRAGSALANEQGSVTVPGLRRTPGTGTPVEPIRTSSPVDLSRLDVPAALSRTDRTVNALKGAAGVGTEENALATPIVRTRADLQHSIDSAASSFGQRTAALVNDAFEFDKNGRIVTIEGLPTIQDLAAQLPRYVDQLTPQQFAAMRQLEAESGAFSKLLSDVGVEVGKRPDVMEGGFYLHRGGADLEGAIEPVKVGSGRGMRGGRTASERPSTFASMTEGIDKGYKYDSFGTAMEDYAKSVGNRAADQKVADYFKNLTDEAGNPIGRGYTERLMDRNPAIKNQWTKATNAVASTRRKLATAEKRAGLNVGKADELDTALTNVETRLPAPTTGGVFPSPSVGTRGLSKLPAQIRREAGRIADLPAADLPVARDASGAAIRARQAEGAARKSVLDHIKALVPDDADKMRFLDTALANTRKRIDLLEARGGQYAEQAKRLRNELGLAEDQVSQLRPVWRKAQDLARSTPRNEGRIGLSQLNDLTFPDPIASAANKWLTKSGKVPAPLAVIQAVNRLARGTMSTLDNSFAGIQGLLGVGQAPNAYRRSMVAMVKSWADPDAAGAALLRADQRAMKEGGLTTQEWASVGAHYGGSATEFTVGQGLSGKLGGIRNAPGVKQANRAFGAGGDVLRREWNDAELLAEMAHTGKTAQELLKDGTAARIANMGNKMTGWTEKRFAGEWGDLLTFAPRWLESRLETLAQGAIGTAKGASPLTRGVGATVEQRMAAQSLQKIVGWSTLATVGINEAMGQETDFRPLVDGRWNPNFMRIRFNGRDYSLLGTYDSLARLMVGVGIAGKDITTSGDPAKGFGELWDALRSQSSPAKALIEDLVSGTDFVQKPTRDNWLQVVKRIGETFAPISGGAQLAPLGGAVKDVANQDWASMAKNVGEFAATNLGGKSSPVTDYEHLDQYSREHYDGRNYDELNTVERQQAKDATQYESQNPAAIQSRKEADKLRATAVEKQDAIDSQHASPGTNVPSSPDEGRAWRDDYQKLQQFVAGQYSARDTIDPFTGKPYGSDMDQAIAAFNAEMDKSTPGVNTDWNQVEAWKAAHPDESALVDQYMRDKVNTDRSPMVTKYKEDYKVIQASHYFDIPDKVAAQVGPALQKSLGLRGTITTEEELTAALTQKAQEIATSKGHPEQAPLILNQLLAPYTAALNGQKELARATTPSLTIKLLRWGYASPSQLNMAIIAKAKE